jgi:hypothetical protein
VIVKIVAMTRTHILGEEERLVTIAVHHEAQPFEFAVATSQRIVLMDER